MEGGGWQGITEEILQLVLNAPVGNKWPFHSNQKKKKKKSERNNEKIHTEDNYLLYIHLAEYSEFSLFPQWESIERLQENDYMLFSILPYLSLSMQILPMLLHKQIYTNIYTHIIFTICKS